MRNELTPIFMFHIGLGLIALLSGAAALILRKGSSGHRMAGKVFVISMLGMSASGVYLALLKPALISVVVGVLTFYLVVSAWLTIYRKPGETGRIETVGLLVVLATAAGGLVLGLEAANSETGNDNVGVPAAIYFFFAGIAALCATLDIRMIYRGGVSGVHRIARHLWRMCFALAIAANAFFVGNPQLFHKSFGIEFRVAPVLAVLLLMFFWLIRVLFTKWRMKAQLNTSEQP